MEKGEKRVVQYDTGLLESPCRSAKDIRFFVDSLPASVARSLERHNISALDAVFYVRTEQYKELKMSKQNVALLFSFLVKLNFIRRDINVRTFGYASLIHDIGKDELVYDLSMLKTNEEYESMRVITWREIEAVDLMLENRLKHRHQRIIRMRYGLDGEKYSLAEIAESFKTDPDPNGPDPDKYPRAAVIKKISDARKSRVELGYGIAIGKLLEDRDDRREYIATLAEKLNVVAKSSLVEECTKKDKANNDKVIGSLAEDILRVLRITEKS